jgi:hypothetical protein
MRQLIEDLISAMEYHVEQTRPIHSTTVALQAAREAIRAQPAPVQEPEQWEHLKAYGYAPGNYMMTCRGCNTEVIGVDKRASRCKPCAIKAAAQPAPVQEPAAVARVDDLERGGRVRALAMGLALDAALYTTPPAQRTWVGLTDEERDAIFELHRTRLGGWDYSGDEVMYYIHFEDAVAAIEAKLKERNQ